MDKMPPGGAEPARAKVVEALNMGLAPNERFDRITRLACRVLEVPLAGLSLVGERRQWFLSTAGFELTGMPRDVSFCAETLDEDRIHVIKNPADETRFEKNPFVVSSPPVRFYAGHPLCTAEGIRVGTLFVMDRRKRKMDDADLDGLRELAALAEAEIGVVRAEDLAHWSGGDGTPGSGPADDVFTQIFLRAGVGMAVSDSNGSVIRANPAVARVLGRSVEEIVGEDAEAFTHPDDVASSKRAFHRLEDGDHERYQVEKRYIRSDGDIMWGRLTVTRLKGCSDDGCVLGILEDITEHVWARQELLRYQDELEGAKEAVEEANRNKSEFLAKMSHELRTPLNSVIGFAKIVGKKIGDDDPKLHSYLDRILANGVHLLGLINDILDLSKVESGKLELQLGQVSIRDLVIETITQLEGNVDPSRLQLVADVADGQDPLLTDRARLKQILINLVGNAVKFTTEGQVRVSVVDDPAGGPPLAIDVVDTGPGIAPERLDAIFDAFQQADNSSSRKFEGTGLGLTISRSLSQVLGFDLHVESRVGVGSTFRIDLKPGRPRRSVNAA